MGEDALVFCGRARFQSGGPRLGGSSDWNHFIKVLLFSAGVEITKVVGLKGQHRERGSIFGSAFEGWLTILLP